MNVHLMRQNDVLSSSAKCVCAMKQKENYFYQRRRRFIGKVAKQKFAATIESFAFANSFPSSIFLVLRTATLRCSIS